MQDFILDYQWRETDLFCFSSRELIAGADALKNVAQILEYIDRISEIKER